MPATPSSTARPRTGTHLDCDARQYASQVQSCASGQRRHTGPCTVTTSEASRRPSRFLCRGRGVRADRDLCRRGGTGRRRPAAETQRRDPREPLRRSPGARRALDAGAAHPRQAECSLQPLQAPGRADPDQSPKRHEQALLGRQLDPGRKPRGQGHRRASRPDRPLPAAHRPAPERAPEPRLQGERLPEPTPQPPPVPPRHPAAAGEPGRRPGRPTAADQSGRAADEAARRSRAQSRHKSEHLVCRNRRLPSQHREPLDGGARRQGRLATGHDARHQPEHRGLDGRRLPGGVPGQHRTSPSISSTGTIALGANTGT